MIYIETNSCNVFYNFAVENYFAEQKDLGDTVFLFWRTTPTLMVGKYQNVAEEINLPYAKEHGITVSRRFSGGGTIYTDMGGWQFSFIERKNAREIEFHEYIAPVIDALKVSAFPPPSTGATTLPLTERNFPATPNTASATAWFITARCFFPPILSRWSPPQRWTIIR